VRAGPGQDGAAAGPPAKGRRRSREPPAGRTRPIRVDSERVREGEEPMTADEFGTVDIDLLADYIGDALDESERDRVARLIADDPQWRSAHALLAPGMRQVGAELSALGAAPEPMPADLGVRLEAAFAADPASDHS